MTADSGYWTSAYTMGDLDELCDLDPEWLVLVVDEHGGGTRCDNVPYEVASEVTMRCGDSEVGSVFASRWDITDADARRVRARFHDGSAVEALARNPFCPPDLLRKFADHTSIGVRHAAAANEQLPVEVQTALAQDTSAWVRCELTRHPDLCDTAVAMLADDEAAEVRARLANSPHLPAIAAEKLAEEQHPTVRDALHANPALPDHVRAWMWAADAEPAQL